MVALIESMNEWIDPAADFQSFYDYVWNVDTAQGFGLDDWGKIVGVSRYLQVPETDYFGFAEALHRREATCSAGRQASFRVRNRSCCPFGWGREMVGPWC